MSCKDIDTLAAILLFKEHRQKRTTDFWDSPMTVLEALSKEMVRSLEVVSNFLDIVSCLARI